MTEAYEYTAPTISAAHRERVMRLSRGRMKAASAAYRAHDLDAAFRLLEEAHVLGQRHLATHLNAHLWMLRVGIKRRDAHEVIGQLVRLLLAPIGNLTDNLPIGNTGGANVPASRQMPIAPELQALLRPLPTELQSSDPRAAA